MPLFGQGLWDDEEYEEKEKDVGANGDIEDCQDLAGSFHNVTCDERSQRNTREEAALESGKGNRSLGRLCAIGGIGVGDSHSGDKGTTKTIKREAHEKPPV